MTASLENLIEILSEKERLMERLARLLEEERRHIVAMDTTAMDQDRLEKSHLISQLEQCNQDCREALLHSASQVGLKDDATLSALIGVVGTPQRTALIRLRGKLQDLNEVLRRGNAFNQELLYEALGMINRSIEFFNSCFGTANTYGYGGQMQAAIAGGRLVSGAI